MRIQKDLYMKKFLIFVVKKKRVKNLREKFVRFFNLIIGLIVILKIQFVLCYKIIGFYVFFFFLDILLPPLFSKEGNNLSYGFCLKVLSFVKFLILCIDFEISLLNAFLISFIAYSLVNTINLYRFKIKIYGETKSASS